VAPALTRTWTFAAAAMAIMAALPALAFAQGTPAPDEARKRLEADKSRLDTTQKRSKDLKTDLDKIAAERQRINARLIETGKLIHQSEGQLTLIESKVDQLQAQEKQLRTTLEERHGTISGLLAAMQRMGRNPPPVMITRREDALSMVRSAMLLAAVFPELRGQAVALAAEGLAVAAPGMLDRASLVRPPRHVGLLRRICRDAGPRLLFISSLLAAAAGSWIAFG